MALDPATGDREPELAAVGLLVVQLEASHAQPAHDQLFQHMANLEHPQDAPARCAAGIDRRTGVLVLQRPFAGHTQTGGAEVVARRLFRTFGIQGGIDEARYPLVESRSVIKVQHRYASMFFGA